MAPAEICVGCGKAIDAAQAYIREDGLRCATCNLRQDVAIDQAKAARSEADDLDRSFTRRARRLGRVHGLMWTCVAILIAGRFGEWYSALIAPAVALAFGLAFRRPWAYWAALVLNAAAVVAGIVWGVFYAPEPLIPIAVTAFPALLMVLVGTLRPAFVRPSSARDDGV